jgi:hypothetical protein
VAWRKEVINSPADENAANFRTQCFDSDSCDRNDVKVNLDELKQCYSIYEDQFKTFFSDFVLEGPGTLVQKVYSILGELGDVRAAAWDARLKEKLVALVAGVFATFTIIKSGESFKRCKDFSIEGGQSMLFEPHNIQVLSILSLLGIADSSSELRNQIMEIRTGEGKSMILGVLSIVLGLLGFSVSCVCYSGHLSERDADLFKDVFAAFAVGDRIVYSSVSAMTEKLLNDKCNIRVMTNDLLLGRELRSPESPEGSLLSPLARRAGDTPLTLNGEEILLVDEVDILFGPEFYGKTYNPIVTVQDLTIEELLKRLWKERDSLPSFEAVKRWAEYREAVEKFSNWKVLLDTELRAMYKDVTRYDSIPYEVDPINSRIGYQLIDTIRWETSYGYKTKFAFLRELEKGTLRGEEGEQAVRDNLGLNVGCGHFSYSRISPTRILGVSGTVQGLAQSELEIIRKFGIDTFTYAPSVYGRNNLIMDMAGEGLSVEKEEGRYFQALANAAHHSVSVGGAALIVFENDDRLKLFQETQYWKDMRHTNVLTSRSDTATRQYVIKKAATSGQVTITTAVFGRGTDFFSQDSKLESAGGMRVVQSFLSVAKSEEVQIKGRTARQGKKGFYQMILLESDLCALIGVAPGEFDTIPRKDRYEWLDTRRQQLQGTRLKALTKKIELADARHDASLKYSDALCKGDRQAAKLALNELYQCKW